MGLITYVYYTANTEDPLFEGRIRRRLLQQLAVRREHVETPLISVSQDPLDDMGHNICVGRKHPCDANAFRQLLIGATAAQTPWIGVAEADCLYPPAYFSLTPLEEGEIYRYSNVWILFGRGGFRKKEYTEGGQVVWRERLIECLSNALRGRPEWSGPDDPRTPVVYRKRHWRYWGDDNQPMLSCKTGRGLRPFTGTIRHIDPVDELPYWGLADELRAKLFKPDDDEAVDWWIKS
jgi:hypothetical protein